MTTSPPLRDPCFTCFMNQRQQRWVESGPCTCENPVPMSLVPAWRWQLEILLAVNQVAHEVKDRPL